MAGAIARTVAVNFDARTEGFERGTQRMAQSAEKAKGSILDVSRQSSKLASVVGSSFSAMSAGIGVATARAEQLPIALIGAGSAMTAAFAAGGPIGLAIAGAATLFGLASRDIENTAAQTAKKLEDEFSKAAQASADAFKTLEAKLEDMRIKAQAAAEGRDPSRQLASAQRARAIAEQEQAITAAAAGLARVEGGRPRVRDSAAAWASYNAARRDAEALLSNERKKLDTLRELQSAEIQAGAAAGRFIRARPGEAAPEMPRGTIEVITNDRRVFLNTAQQVQEHLRKTEQWQQRVYGELAVPKASR